MGSLQGITRITPPDSILSCGIRASYKVFDNVTDALADKRLYEIYSNNKYIISILNSFLFHLFTESDTRQLGDGFIDLTVYEVEQVPIPKNDLLTEVIIDAYNVIKGRKIKPILEEYKQKDRIELDKAILDVLDLDPDEYIPKIYSGIIEMVKERLNLPKMRKRQITQKAITSYEEVKKSVIEECNLKALQKFPEGFYSIKNAGKEYDDLEFDIYNTSGKPLIYEYFIGQYTVADVDGQKIITTKFKPVVDFVLIYAKPNVYQIKIPKDWKIAETIVDNYHNYIAQLKERIELNANQKLHDWSEAEKMTNEILEEYDLKK